MKLSITLTPTEEANIRGWANHYNAHPEEVPTRIVLEERTQERLAEIMKQLSSALPIDVLPRGARNFVAFDDRIVSIPFTGPNRVSVSVADGVQVFLGVSAAPGDLSTYGNGAALVDAPAGEWYANVKLGEAMGAFSANLWLGQA